MAKLICPKCCSQSAQCECHGDISPGYAITVKYVLECSHCGHQEDEHVSGGDSSWYDWFTNCPYCGQEERVHWTTSDTLYPLQHPMRTTTIDPAWLTSTVTVLAQVIHKKQSYDVLPILADALEESGCTDTVILNHCRSSGSATHLDRCWVVDLLLAER